jgi:hypothetical protein
MQKEVVKKRLSPETPGTRHVRIRRASILALAVVCSVVLPVVAIFLGVFLMAAAALHAWSFSLRPYLQPILRVPVARPHQRRTRLLVAAGAGALLVLCGSLGATIRGQLRSQWEQRATRLEDGDKRVREILDRARFQLSVGNIEGAELELLNADAVVGMDDARRAEVDDLLQRVRLARDPKAILAVLTQLPQGEFEAFAKGESVPEALVFPEQALTLRAVDIALRQIDEARKARGRP